MTTEWPKKISVLAVGMLAVAMGIYTEVFLGPAAIYPLLIIVPAVIVKWVPGRITMVFVVIFTLFALLPLISYGQRTFEFPLFGVVPPLIDDHHGVIPFYWIHRIGERLAGVSERLAEVIGLKVGLQMHFDGEGAVRVSPFSVFAVWVSIALSLLLGFCARAKSKRGHSDYHGGGKGVRNL